MKLRHTALIAFVFGATAVFAGGHDDVPPEIKARNALMQLYSTNLGTLGGMAKGEIAYDADLAQAAADRLVALSNLSQVGMWSEGTSSDDTDKSRALPVAFTELDKVLELNGDLHEAALQAAAVAGDGQEAIGGTMKALGDACSACHKAYRKPK